MEELKVIEGHQLVDVENPGFYSIFRTEDFYYKLICDSQKYFEEGCFEEDKDIKLPGGGSAYITWVEPHCVRVVDCGNGTYRVNGHGRHRAYVANKHNLSILVRVSKDDMRSAVPNQASRACLAKIPDLCAFFQFKTGK